MERIVFDKIFNSIKPIQNPDKLYWLINEVEKISTIAILEIGIELDEALMFWNHILKENGLLIGIDVQRILGWDITKSKNDIMFIMQDSTKEDTANNIESILKEKNRQLDFLFIDGGHYEHIVTSDYQKYNKFVRKGGIIGFHDANDIVGIKRFWDKVGRNKELYTSKSSGMGIGIIRI